MSNLNHERPVFRVIAAGGGERIRTVAEDLAAAQADLRREAASSDTRPRCGSCGSRREVKGTLTPRCADCRTEEAASRSERKSKLAPAPRGRATQCSKCYVELPVNGLCGFCG